MLRVPTRDGVARKVSFFSRSAGTVNLGACLYNYDQGIFV